MRRLENGAVYLEVGEVLPVWCACGHIYQPTEGSARSKCSACTRENIHDDQKPVRVVMS